MEGIKYLTDKELTFEILSRNLSPKLTVTSKRIQLEIALQEKKTQKLNPFDWDTNIQQLNESMNSIENNLKETFDSELIQKLETQIVHVKNRIAIIDSKNNEEHRCLLKSFLLQLNNFEKTLLEKESQTLNDSYVQNPSTSPRVKSIDVFKWKFEPYRGHSDERDILTFLEQIEDLRVARGANYQNLFESSTDLFSKEAIHFCRIAKSKTYNWEGFVKLLKAEFLPLNYQVESEQKFQNSNQGNADIFTYLTEVETLAKKLERPVSEQELIQVILRGIQPYFASILIASEYSTLEELKHKCKRIHELKIRNSSYRAQSKALNTIADQLTQMNVETTNDSASPANNASINAANFELTCWNCNQKNHRYSECHAERKIFCFACGYPGVYKDKCPRCLATSGNERGGMTLTVEPVSANLHLTDPESTRSQVVRGTNRRGRGRGVQTNTYRFNNPSPRAK